LFDENGDDLAEVLERVSGETTEITIENVDMPAFLSLNRGYSFYGKLVYRASQEELLMQVRRDRDIIGRFTAFYTLRLTGKNSGSLRILKQGPLKTLSNFTTGLLNDRAASRKGRRTVPDHF